MRKCNPRKWSDSARWEAALQCSSKGEYLKRFNGAYAYDLKHGLLDRYTHFRTPIHKGRNPDAEDYVVYTYTDKQNKVVYVGLTYEERKEKRHWEHLYGRRNKNGDIIYDVVAKYWQNIGQSLPEPRYVMEGLHINDVGYYEEWYRNAYEKAGWKALNIAKTGGIGGAKVKWTYETTAEESRKYKTRNAFKKGNSPAYYKAVRTLTESGISWIDTFFWFEDSHKVRSEASKKRQSGYKLSEEHKRNISNALKAFHNKKAA